MNNLPKNPILINALLLLVFTILVCSCKRSYPITFSEAQPTGVRNLSEIPRILHGIYINPVDSTELIINKQIIKTRFVFEFKFHKDEFQNSDVNKNDSLPNASGESKSIMRMDGDSVIIRDEYIDTVFLLNQDQVLKKFDSCFYVSTKTDGLGWGVSRIEVSKDKIVLSYLSEVEDIEKLSQITERSLEPNIQNVITLTKKEFRDFIEDGGFRSSVSYIRTYD